MAAEGHPVQVAVRVLGVPESGFHAWRDRGPSARADRQALLTYTTRQVHAASNGVYGVRRVHAEPALGRGLRVWYARRGDADAPGRPQGSHRLFAVAVSASGPGLSRPGGPPVPRRGLDQLWVTDITEHPAREGKVYCVVVLDVCSRRVAGRAIDSSPTAALATNALGMAIDNRESSPGTVIHSDHGAGVRVLGLHPPGRLAPSVGSIGDCYDNVVIASFWSRMQVELLDRRRRRDPPGVGQHDLRVLEAFHNRQRRHSAIGWLTPVEFEKRQPGIVA